MIAQAKTWLAVAGAVVLLLAASNGYTYLRTDASAYARGVRDQKIITLSKTEALNARIEQAEAATTAAAVRAADAARELQQLQLENAYDRARDPAASGRGLPPSELRRVSRVP